MSRPVRIPLDTHKIKSILEALIFASDSPVRVERLAEIVEFDRPLVASLLKELQESSEADGRGFVLCAVADGYQYRTRAEYAEWLQRLHKQRPFRFSRASLETLAIIAYRQPVTRAEIEYLRGVDSGAVVKTLLEKRLIRILGKKEIAGRPLIYGTSREFLEFFNLPNLSSLPTLREFSELEPDTLATLTPEPGEAQQQTETGAEATE